MGELKERLLKDIIKTGFPLELKIASILEENLRRVLRSIYYVDKDEMKGREIDLVAYDFYNTRDENEFMEYVWYLTIEIKKAASKPWVFFTSRDSTRSYPYNFVFNDSAKNKKYGLRGILFKNEGLHKYLGRSFYEGFTNNGGRDDIYKALSGAVKAMCHFRDSSNARGDKSTDLLIESYEPLVVVEGDLFSAKLNENQEIEIEETNYVQVSFNYLSPNYQIENEYSLHNQFLVHVVKSDYLEEFIMKYKDKQMNLFNGLIEQSNEIGDTNFTMMS